MRYVAGIDGGQTSTAAVIGDERGRVVGRGVAGPADEVGQGADSTRMHDALSGALRAACKEAGLDADAHFEAIVAGVSGYEGRVYGKVPELSATRFVLMHDAPIAHAGALAGEAGVVVIAGTGSVVYATDGKEGWTLGGWGYLFGDEGSAFWLAREALASLMHAQDIGVAAPDDVRRACEFFDLPSLRAIARAFYAGELTRDRIAAFASVDVQSGRSWSDVTFAATKLSWLVREAILRGAPARVTLVGGMFNDSDFAATVAERIENDRRGTEIVVPKYDPAVGALILAYREAGISGIEIAVR
jgi:N-acetylglucosamine kinase-like BadF-type ATPase